MSADEPGTAQVREAFRAYEAAVEAGDRAEVAAARMSLCATLQSTGWVPPQEVRDQLWRDQKLVREREQERAVGLGELFRMPSHRPPASVHREAAGRRPGA